MPYLGIFALELEHTIVIMEISALELALLQSLVQKENSWIWNQEMPYLGIFVVEFENNIAIFKVNAFEFA